MAGTDRSEKEIPPKVRQNRRNDQLQATISKLLGHLAPPPATPYRDRFMIKQGQRLLYVGIEVVAYFFSRHKVTFLKPMRDMSGCWIIRKHEGLKMVDIEISNLPGSGGERFRY